MLGRTRLTTILPVADIARARRFYGETLGLEPKGSAGDGTVLFACANGAIGLVPKPVPDPATHTSASFEVDDIGKEIAELTRRGILFEDYDLPGLKTVDKVCVLGGEKAAWFKDPDGNILCLHERRRV